jgi:hypothetical protein
MNIISEFLPILQKYQGVTFEEVSIKVTKYDDGVTMAVSSDTPEIGDLLSDLMINVAKMAGKEGEDNVNVEVVDKRAL